MNRKQITTTDYHKILSHIEKGSFRAKSTQIVDKLVSKLDKALRISPVQVPKSIVTMNSCVVLQNTLTGSENIVTITYPHEADPAKGKVSLFTPIGVALLGCKVGDTASWAISSRVSHYMVKRILYQPEAAGDYHL